MSGRLHFVGDGLLPQPDGSSLYVPWKAIRRTPATPLLPPLLSPLSAPSLLLLAAGARLIALN